MYSQQASRGALHKASINGECDTVKMLLDSGEDVDQRDEVLFSFHLCTCKSSVIKSCLELHVVLWNSINPFEAWSFFCSFFVNPI